MKTYSVRFTRRADRHLSDLYAYIADRGGRAAAKQFVEGIVDACLSLRNFPERGHKRDDIRPGLRIIGHARRVAIAFSVDPTRDSVVIHGAFYGGQDIQTASTDFDDR